MSKKYVIVYSGGMDSSVLLHKYSKDILLAISFNYGSKHNDIEYEYAKKNIAKFGIKHIRIDLPFINEFFTSDLLQSGGEIPEGHYEDVTMKRTVVPFRNGIMLSIAAGLADSLSVQYDVPVSILIANHSGDHAIYRDCREEFIYSMGDSITLGTDSSITIEAPFTKLTKRDIALIGKHETNIDFNETYSCYKGGVIHCGVCGTCVERKEALQGFDPTSYIVSN